MPDVGQCPERERDRITDAGADPVDDRAEAEVTDCVGGLEPEHDVGILGLGPLQLGLQGRLQHADRLPVDVVDGRCREQQRADQPPVAANPRRRIAAHWWKSVSRETSLAANRRAPAP